MNRRLYAALPDSSSVMATLQPLYAGQLDHADLALLAHAITPYLARTDLPWAEAINKISFNYLRDGVRVQRLLSDAKAPEWESVLTNVLMRASQHRLYPRDTDATTWPDLDAYADIQRKLPSYNFEGSLNSWISIIVVNRLRRYWRDRQAISVGGSGFKTKAEREIAKEKSTSPAKTQHYSLEKVMDHDWFMAHPLTAGYNSVVERVEATELRRLVVQSIERLAVYKQDTLLPSIWESFVEQRLKLREIAALFGLTVAQVYRRIEQVRLHLRQDPVLNTWLASND